MNLNKNYLASNSPNPKQKKANNDFTYNPDVKMGIESYVTEFHPLPLWYILENYVFETQAEVMDPIMDVKQVEFVQCWFPNKIQDKDKKAVFIMLTNIFQHLNPSADLYVIQSYIFGINEMVAVNPMELNNLLSLVWNVFNISVQVGLWFTPIIKYVHFNPTCGLSIKEKKMISEILNKGLRTKTAIEKEKDGHHSSSDVTYTHTQAYIAKLTKMSRRNIGFMLEEISD